MTADLNAGHANSVSSAFIQSRMIHRERAEITGFILWVLLSAPGILIDSLFLSGILYLLGPFRPHHVPWRHVFFWSIPAAVLLFWLIDHATPESDSASDLDAAAAAARSGGTRMTTATGHLAMSPWTPGIGARGSIATPVLTEIILMGPRILRKAFQRLRGAWSVRNADRSRVEQILRTMSAVDHSLHAEELLHQGENVLAISAPLAYLLFYGWVECSHDAARVWLIGKSRSILEAPTARPRAPTN